MNGCDRMTKSAVYDDSNWTLQEVRTQHDFSLSSWVPYVASSLLQISTDCRSCIRLALLHHIKLNSKVGCFSWSKRVIVSPSGAAAEVMHLVAKEAIKRYYSFNVVFCSESDEFSWMADLFCTLTDLVTQKFTVAEITTHTVSSDFYWLLRP